MKIVNMKLFLPRNIVYPIQNKRHIFCVIILINFKKSFCLYTKNFLQTEKFIEIKAIREHQAQLSDTISNDSKIFR